jgi:hypothetical protein
MFLMHASYRTMISEFSEYGELYISEKCKYRGCGSKKGLVEETKTLKQKKRG